MPDHSWMKGRNIPRPPGESGTPSFSVPEPPETFGAFVFWIIVVIVIALIAIVSNQDEHKTA